MIRWIDGSQSGSLGGGRREGKGMIKGTIVILQDQKQKEEAWAENNEFV